MLERSWCTGRRGATWAASALLALVLAVPAAAQPGAPAGPVPAELLAARRNALLERVRDGVVVVRSADERDIEADYAQDSDFRQDNTFFYLTGLETPRSWLVLEARDGAPVRSLLYLPPRNPHAERWTGPQLGPGPEAAQLTGITDVRSTERVTEEVEALAAGGAAVHLWIPPSVEPDALARRLLSQPNVSTSSLAPHLAAVRVVKDADELARLRRAIALTTEAQRAAMRAVAPGMWEYELEAVIEYTFRRGGAERVGFPSIVGSGPNSTVLHYDKSRRRMEAGDLVVVDIGAEYGYYTADVTRTFPVSGRFTERQRAIYDLVLGAQQATIAAIRPGVRTAELEAIARRYLREHSNGLCGAATCDRYLVHGVSHWLGMDVHDVGNHGTPLAPGMVLTVEPGIYLPEEGLGIRIEDDVLVTADGHEVLSADAPRNAEEIEQWMAGPAPDLPAAR